MKTIKLDEDFKLGEMIIPRGSKINIYEGEDENTRKAQKDGAKIVKDLELDHNIKGGFVPQLEKIGTRMVSGRSSSLSFSGWVMHMPSTGRKLTAKPSFSSICAVWRMAWCSTAEVMTCFPFFLLAATAPRSAMLSLSDPPPVKTISSGLA